MSTVTIIAAVSCTVGMCVVKEGLKEKEEKRRKERKRDGGECE